MALTLHRLQKNKRNISGVRLNLAANFNARLAECSKLLRDIFNVRNATVLGYANNINWIQRKGLRRPIDDKLLLKEGILVGILLH